MTDYKCAWVEQGPNSKKFCFQYFGWEPVEAISVEDGVYSLLVNPASLARHHLVEIRDALREDYVSHPECREVYDNIMHEIDRRDNEAYAKRKRQYKIPHWRCIDNVWVCMEDGD